MLFLRMVAVWCSNKEKVEGYELKLVSYYFVARVYLHNKIPSIELILIKTH